MRIPEGLEPAQEDEYRDRWQDGWSALEKLPIDGGELGFFAKRHHKKARESFERCLELAPDGAAGLWGMARLARVGGDLNEAWTLYERASASDGVDPDLALDSARVALALGKPAAEELARTACDGKPGDDEALVVYAYALLLAGQAKRALGVIANVCKRDPDHAAARACIELVRKVINGDVEAPATINV